MKIYAKEAWESHLLENPPAIIPLDNSLLNIQCTSKFYHQNRINWFEATTILKSLQLNEHRQSKIKESGSNHGPLIKFAENQKVATSEFKRANETNGTTKQKIEENNCFSSELMAVMSHEIRTPLNGIMGMLQLLLKTSIDQKQREYIELAFASSKDLLSLVNDILNLSKAEAGKLDLEDDDFVLEAVIAKVCETLESQIEQQSVTLKLHIDSSIPATIRGDETKLRQILFNLIGNAIKFTNKGMITIDVSPLQMATKEGKPRLSHCNYDPGKLTLLLIISDEGIGIPDDKLDMIFQPFNQARKFSKRNFSGTGLGLSIVNRFIKIMGGSISIISEIEKGTTVYVSLPFKI